ncbi:uncharacterized protein LOC108678129 isoform X2 [Hyalella azteca]|nr:uncharacterized protein LOC108678129 isoform X2 [Hyalella azteca]
MAFVRAWVLAVTLIAVAYATELEDSNAPAAASPAAAKASEVPPKGVSNFAKEKAFFGSYRTITRTGVSLLTSTVPVTCFSGLTAALCLGRKRRRVFLDGQLPDQKMNFMSTPEAAGKNDKSTTLDSSQEESNEAAVDEENDGRFVGGLYTIWNSSTTSTTVTVRYTDTATTVKVSYYCTIKGMDVPTVFC